MNTGFTNGMFSAAIGLAGIITAVASGAARADLLRVDLGGKPSGEASRVMGPSPKAPVVRVPVSAAPASADRARTHRNHFAGPGFAFESGYGSASLHPYPILPSRDRAHDRTPTSAAPRRSWDTIRAGGQIVMRFDFHGP